MEEQASAAALFAPLPSSPLAASPSPTFSATLFSRVPATLTTSARIRHHCLRWRDAAVALRGRTLVFGESAVEVVAARPESRSRVVVTGRNGDDLTLEFARAEEARAWAAALAEVAAMEDVGLGDFDVLSAIGKGGSGEVFLCRRRGEDRLLAMKVVQKFDVFHSESTLRHCLDERLCLEFAREHPYVVSLRYAFQSERAMYLVTDFASGGDLRTTLNRLPGKKMDEAEGRLVLAQMVLAVADLNRRGIIHRDIKIENVLLDSDGNAQLCDMGLAKVLATGPYGRTRSFCGTPGSMAPEVARKSGGYGSKVDVWGLGTLLYRVLVGRMPFADRNKSPLQRAAGHGEVLRRIVQDEVLYPSSLSIGARELLEGMLEKGEDKRMNFAEVMESKFFASIDFEELERKPRVAAVEGGAESGEESDVSRKSAEVEALSNFETERLKGVEINPEEILEHGGKSHSTDSSSSGKGPVAAKGNAKSSQHGLRSMLKRVASTGRMAKRPSETSIIGFAYANGYDARIGAL